MVKESLLNAVCAKSSDNTATDSYLRHTVTLAPFVLIKWLVVFMSESIN